MTADPSNDALTDGFEGGCFCGAIHYRVHVAPRFTYLCHCSDCRRINGSALHAGIAVDASGFEITAGTPHDFATTADSGHTITRYACARCGTQLWSITTADMSMVSLKAGSVTSVAHEDIRPTLQIFWDSRVPWVEVPGNLTTYARGLRGATPIC